MTEQSHALPATQQELEAQTYWDRINQARWGQYLSALEERTVQHALRLCSNPGVVVDIGCGSGRWSALAAKAGWRAICLDIDKEILKVCQQNAPEAVCRQLDPSWTHLPVTTGCAQAVLCVEVFTIMGQERLNREVHRALTPGGLFVGVFGNLLSWRGLLAQLPIKGPQHRTYYPKTYGAWRREMQQRGFEYIHEEGYGWAPFNRGSDSPLIPLSAQLEEHLGLRRWKLFSPWVIFIARKSHAS